METLTILNNSPMPVEVYFCFQNDVKASTYFLEPVNMSLKPNERQVKEPGTGLPGQEYLGNQRPWRGQETALPFDFSLQILTIWAYPTGIGVFEDNIVCCIKENPEPAIFRLSCQGIRPELELEPRQLHFDRLLLHRSEF